MDVNWLRKLLHRLPGDMEVFINVDGEMIPLCGKADISILVYNTPDEPDVDKGQQVITLNPCFCEHEETDIPEDRTLLN